MRLNRKLVLLLLALGAGVTVAAWQRNAKLSASSQAVAKARAVQINKELAQLAGHPWAGSYYYGDGLGVNVSLLIAPKSGFVFSWHGCMGLYDLNYGGVGGSSERLKLLFEQPNRREGFEGIDPELTPVLWGERHYLIPSDKLLDFVNRINGGYEPRQTMHGMALLRVGDERKAVRGDPGVPSEYRGLILPAPITARISSVGKSRLETSSGCDSTRRVTPVTLDAGSAKGVKVGMDFQVFAPARIYESLRITKVEDQVSEAEAIQCPEDKPPSTEWQLSTRAVGKR